MAGRFGTLISRADARARNLKYYRTGKPCKRGHWAVRFVSCRTCSECAREKSALWYSDRERAAKKTRSWRARNRKRYKAARNKYVAANKERLRASAAHWAKKNRDKRRRSCRQWYERNAEQERQRGRAKRSRNIQGYRDYSVTYNRRNLERLAAIARNRRARVRQNGGTHTAADVAEIFRVQGHKCAYCQADLAGKKRHVDHITPLAKGGSNDRRNLQILCVACNKSKSARDPIEFMQSKGKLL